mgnify:CR=1 FL=1
MNFRKFETFKYKANYILINKTVINWIDRKC